MIIGLVVVAFFLAHAIELRGLRLPLLANLEAIVYDTRLRLTMPQTVDPRIVILDIDEKSLAEKEQGGEGRWPWPRDRLALLQSTALSDVKVYISVVAYLDPWAGVVIDNVEQIAPALEIMFFKAYIL